MGDRLDIDALLIGSLYGELSAADDARLQAHLESHPTDRAALAGLTRARELLRESRYLQVQLEPPQAISALLLQQAAQLAPKVKAVAVEAEREGWFARFVRTFVGHPAMAAATMLVLVLGVAGVLYVRKGDHFAEPTHAPTHAPTEQPNVAAGEAEKRQEKSKDKDKVDSYKADLQDPGPPPVAAKTDGKLGGNATASPDRMVPSQRVLEAKTAPGPTVKELDDEKAAGANEKATPSDPTAKLEVKRPQAPAMTPPTKPRTQALEGHAETADAILAEKETRNRDLAPGNAQAPTGAARTSVTTTPPTTGSGSATIARSEEQSGETLAWAKQQHTKLTTETQRNQCEAAAATAVALSLRAPGYYQANVETDRTLKQCAAYINRARELDNEARTRAARKRLEQEAAPLPKAAPASSDSKR